MPIVFLVDLRVFEHRKKTFWWRIMSGHPLCKFVLKTMLLAKDDISNLEKHFIVWWVPCAFGTVWSVINHFVKVSFQIYNPVCSSSINLFSWDWCSKFFQKVNFRVLGDDEAYFSSLNLQSEENALIALRIFLASRNMHKIAFFCFSSIPELYNLTVAHLYRYEKIYKTSLG